MSIRNDRDHEVGLYVSAYESESYGMGRKRKCDVERLLRGLRVGSLLDVGCGRGESLEIAGRLGFGPLAGTEVVPDLVGGDVVHAYAHSLPFEDGQFEHVTCFDVLEHLVEEDIVPALTEMFRVASVSVTVSASERPSVFGGVDLHISRRPAAEWASLLRSAWGREIVRSGRAGGSPCFQVFK